jgi:hypothetical protein
LNTACFRLFMNEKVTVLHHWHSPLPLSPWGICMHQYADVLILLLFVLVLVFAVRLILALKFVTLFKVKYCSGKRRNSAWILSLDKVTTSKPIFILQYLCF